MDTKVATVVSYCTNDFRFIDRCIEEARKFSSQIIIPVCDHFFDGTPENRALLDQTYAAHPDCLFVEFAYFNDRFYSPYHRLDGPQDKDWALLWCTATRYVGFHYLDPEIEWIFFLDSDEIIEGEAMAAWLESANLLDAQRLAAYLYALRPTLRAKKVVNLPLLVKRSTLAPLTLLNPLDRIGAYQTHPGPKREQVVGLNGLPMVHHYSWVRTKEECYQKTRTWGHRHDEDWPRLIENTFSGKSPQLFDLSWHEFEEIPAPYFDPFAPRPSRPTGAAQVLKIDDRDLFLKSLELV